jgi:exosome complex RNA-binding protein Csl4
MKILEPAQDSDASATADIVKAEVLAKVSYAVSRKDSALRVIKAVAKYHSLHTNLKLDYTSGKAKTAVEHQVS